MQLIITTAYNSGGSNDVYSDYSDYIINHSMPRA